MERKNIKTKNIEIFVLKMKIRIMRVLPFLIVLIVMAFEKKLNILSNHLSKDVLYFVLLLAIFAYGMFRYEKEYTDEWNKEIEELKNKKED